MRIKNHRLGDKKNNVELPLPDIILRPKLTVAPRTDHTQALRIMEKAEKACLVSASLSTPVRLQAEVIEG